MKWEPEEYDADPTVNAILNVAAALTKLAAAADGIIYGLKYSKDNGMSIAESIEVAGKVIAESLDQRT